jgi:hypothetical protein
VETVSGEAALLSKAFRAIAAGAPSAARQDGDSKVVGGAKPPATSLRHARVARSGGSGAPARARRAVAFPAQRHVHGERRVASRE